MIVYVLIVNTTENHVIFRINRREKILNRGKSGKKGSSEYPTF